MIGNSFGRVFRVTTCGESYGVGLLVIVDGVPAGLPLSESDVQKDLDRRRPGQGTIVSPRQEKDQVKIVSGVFDGRTTGAPVGMVVYNVDTEPFHVKQYEEVSHLVRPGHAEYTYHVKYGPFRDWRGAGRASGRETVMRVAAGAVAKKLLMKENIEVVAYVKELYGIRARAMGFEEIKQNVDKTLVRCPDLEAAEKMIAVAERIKEEGDTCGGIVEVIARNVPPGLGEPVFDKLSADIAKGLMSIGSVKGVEFGAGFAAAQMKGSEFNDIPYIDEDGRVRFRSNNAGGLLGGISNGEDLVVRVAVKPTATVSKEQETINIRTMEKAVLRAITRRDATICPRIVPVAEAMVAVCIADHYLLRRALAGIYV